MTATEIADVLVAFLARRFGLDESEPDFSRDVHLWQSGFLDSIALGEILKFIEATFQVRMPDHMLVDERLGSVNGLSRAVLSLKQGSK